MCSSKRARCFERRRAPPPLLSTDAVTLLCGTALVLASMHFEQPLAFLLGVAVIIWSQ